MGLLAAISMHSIWNGSGAIFGGAVWVLTYILLMIPSFLIILVVIILALRREGQIVRENLVADYQAGLLTQQEYDRLCTIRGRMGSSFNAFSRGGFRNWQAARQLNQTATIFSEGRAVTRSTGRNKVGPFPAIDLY